MRTSQNYSNNLINEDGTKNMEAYDDTYVKKQMGDGPKGKLYEHFGWELMEGDFCGIDMKFVNDPDKGLELEHGGWNTDDFWTDPYCDLFFDELGYSSVNLPHRKFKYPTEDKLWRKDKNGKWEQFPNLAKKEETLFVRTNKKLNNYIVIPASLILEGKFVIKERYVQNSGKIEKFMCFKREDVLSYKEIDGKIVQY
jgi:hypothetical protein